MGWGPGRSRVTDPKRHFRKPIPLSPLVRIDRERCILCYRCVRFSQEVAEDEQLQLLERGAETFVGTFDDRPYIAPFHGNIIELCPVGALTSEAYRFRARPWDIEDSGSICTLCPSQCNVKFTVRDERIQRVLARDNHEVDNGWLCDKGRFGFQMINSEERITEPRVRRRRRSTGRARSAPRPSGCAAAGRADRRDRRRPRLERGGLPRPADRPRRARLGRRHAPPTRCRSRSSRRSRRPELSVATSAIEEAESVLLIGADPLQRDADPRPAAAKGRPALEPAARRRLRAPDGARRRRRGDRPATRPARRRRCSRRSRPSSAPIRRRTARSRADAERLAGELRPGKTIVIWGERIGRGAERRSALDALLERRLAAQARRRRRRPDLESPHGSNARGIRESGRPQRRRPRASPTPRPAARSTRSRRRSPAASSRP